MVDTFHPEFIQIFLPRIDVYIFPSYVFRCLAFLELSSGSVHCAPDENDRPSEETELCFAFVNLCCFLNSLFGELTKIRASDFQYLLNIKEMRTKATSLPTRSKKISAFKFALEYQKKQFF